MSSQTRIDQYFKSTSSNKVTHHRAKLENGSNRSKRALSLTRQKNSTASSIKAPVAASAGKKKLWGHSNSKELYTEFEASERSARSSIPSFSASSQSCSSRTFADVTSADVQIIDRGNVTATKKTIKSFAKACNSPPKNPLPGRISLKRRKNNFPKPQSPLKKGLTYDDNFTVNSEPDIIEIPIPLSSIPTTESSIFQDDFSKDFDPDIIELNIENSNENSAEKLSEKFKVDSSNNADRNVTPEKQKFGGVDRGIDDAEEPLEAKRNKLEDSCGTSTPIKKNVAATKGKNTPLSSCGNSPSISPWKVAATINTPNRWMTALSSDWQNMQDVMKKRYKPSNSDKDTITTENFETLGPKSKGNDENLSNDPVHDTVSNETVISSVMNSRMRKRESIVNFSLIKHSPRRSLFSPPDTPKKKRFEMKDCASSLSELNAETDLTMLINGGQNSPVSPLQPMNLRINSQFNSPSKKEQSINSPTMEHESIGTPTKINGSSNSPAKMNGSSNSPTRIHGSLNLSTKTYGSANSPIKGSMSQTPTSSRSSSTSHSPPNANAFLAVLTKTATRNCKSSFSPKVKNSPQKIRKERVDLDLATRAVENLNQAKQGVIPLNNFDLEVIYVKKSFELEYGSLNTDAAIKYEARDVQVPEDKHADHLFMVLVNVFSEPMNCGYFNDNELDTVFSILTLSPEAQSLLARMLKRRRGWHRVSAIQYPEIGADLKPFVRELVEHGFFHDDIANEEMSILLNLLQADEIKAACQAMNINRKGLKPKLIADLVKLSSKKHSLFPGIKTPNSALSEKVTSMLGPCIRLPQSVENLLNRIFILLIPTQDPKETIVETLNMLVLVHIGEKIFPSMPKERFPIFRDRLHLIRYAEARSAWNHVIKASEIKDWDKVRALGQLAYDRLEPYFESNDSGDESGTSTLPSHVERFDANYAWIKVLSKSVEAYKKTKEGIDTAAKFLQALISQRNKMPGNRIRWYGELALIEMYHRKNLETSANITIEALKRDRLSEIDAAEMLDRAKKLLKRRQGISVRTKERINEIVQLRHEMFISTTEPVVNEIEARMVQGNVTGSKSTWSIAIGTDVGFMSVEQVALRHYSDKGFKGGLHCEGALPVTLFATLFWDAIYDVSVPGAFVSPYQDAPLDLYTSGFLDNRRELIERKFMIVRALKVEYLSQMMHEDFVKYRPYQSLIHGNLFKNADDFKDFIECLGIDGVIGICERLVGNYNQWKSGFPDLVLWDSATKMCKIVEVKGPGDSLSTKQRLWIQCLECLGIPVEVCVVKGTTIKYTT